MAKRPLGVKPVSPIIPIALALKARGYDPLWLYSGKGHQPKNWPHLPNTPEDIAGWHGKSVAVRMAGHEDLFAIDMDVQIQEVLDAIIEKYSARWPDFMQRCVIRHSGAVKVMLIGRLTTEKRRMYSGRYGAEVVKGGNRVELFTSNDNQYIAVWGMHSEGREYGYDGPQLHEVDVADLPEFFDEDLNELLDIANKTMEAAGLKLTDAPGAVLDEVAYDLEPGQLCEPTDGSGTITLEELEKLAQGQFVYLHGRIFDPDTETNNRVKAKVTPGRGLTLWDFGTGIVHYWKHLGPQIEVLAPLLKQLAADEAVRTAPGGAGGGGGTTVFTPMALGGAGRITQDEAALLFANTFGDTLKYCHDTGRWYNWTGVYWQPERTKLAFQYARELARLMSEQSRPTELKEVRKVSFAGGVERFAQGDRRVATTADNWNRDIYLMGTPDGTLDLRTGLLSTPKQEDGITRLTAVSPIKGRLTPLWIKFLKETFKNDKGEPDRELIEFAQMWFGYCLTGDISEHALWFGFGEGGNGKGVLINTIHGIMKDYAVTATMDAFTASKGDRHSTELAMLQGARLVTASETEKGRAWAEARIKQITGGDPITARFMRQDNFTFIPQFKLTLIGNHKPVLRGVDDAVKRRFNMVPFLNKPAVVNKRLEAQLRQEWPGIMQWLVEGCLMWMARGLPRPEAVKVATESYFEDQDLTGQWLADCCDIDRGPGVHATTATLFASWKHFAEQAGEWPGNRKSFTTELIRRGFEPFRYGPDKLRSVRGVKLKKTPIAKAILTMVDNDLSDKKDDTKND